MLLKHVLIELILNLNKTKFISAAHFVIKNLILTVKSQSRRNLNCKRLKYVLVSHLRLKKLRELILPLNDSLQLLESSTLIELN